MRPSRHLALSAAAGAAAWAVTDQPWALPVTLATGVLIDIDHGPDFWWSHVIGRKPVAVLILHAWEWLAGLLIIGIWAGFPWWMVAILVGYGLHVSTDHLFNRGRLLTYSLLYRASFRFEVSRLAPNWNSIHTYRILQNELPYIAKLYDWWRHKRTTGIGAGRSEHTESETNK